MAKKCFLSRSAEERVKIQAKQMKKMDKFVNKKVKSFKNWWKKKVEKKLAWGVLAAVVFSMVKTVLAKQGQPGSCKRFCR